MKFIISLIVIAIATLLLGMFTLNLQLNAKLEYSNNLEFEVLPGEGFNLALARVKKMLPSFPIEAAKIYLKITKQDQSLKISEYEIPPNQSAYQILNFLLKGQNLEKVVTIQEGFNIYQIAYLMESQNLCKASDFIAKTKDLGFILTQLGYEAPSLEGYLFPDTYRLPKKWPVEKYIQIFVQKHKDVWSEIEKEYAPGLSHHQLVILASMIEKETGAGFERPMISSVFHNRLKKSMRLQSDPTTIYGVWVETGKMKKNITKKDLLTSTPYNTYTVTGLPFGPIANPGKAALIAAIKPLETNNYYFVSKNDGTHQFSRTYDEHLAAVRKFQLDAKAREGKSWRDLKQN
jgi:UPF0755 protein